MTGSRAPTRRIRDALRQVAANGSLRRVEAGWLIAIAAEWAYLVTLLVFAYDTGGIVAVGLLSTLRLLPAAGLGPLLISVTDAMPRGRILAGVHSSRGLAVAVVAFMVVADMPLPAIVAVVTVEGILATLHRPTTMSLLPALARSPEELIAGNAVTSSGEAIGVLIGPAAGAVLLTLGGAALGLSAPAAAFGVAALVVARIDRGAASRATRSAHLGASRALAGFSALRSYPSAGSLVAIFISQTFVRGVLVVLLVAASVELLGLGRAGVGYLNSAIGAGGVLGGIVAFGLVMRRDLARPFSISLAAWGIPIVLIGLAPESILAFAFLGVLGLANAVLDVSGFTLLQRSVPNELRAIVFGALESLVGLSVAAGSFLAPVLVTLVGLQPAMVLVGMLLPALALLTRRTVRTAEHAAVVPHRELAVLRAIPMFAPLTLTALERLAGGMLAVRFDPGTTIIRQGEPGHDYFVLASGTADVIQDAVHIGVLRAGDGFGEIALLRDVPRTASVVGRDAVEAFRLPRAVFLEAVTGNVVSADLADRVVSERLAPNRR
jgi:hypothetical protein